MAATYHVSRNDLTPAVHASIYPQPLMTDLNLRDNRYPTISSSQSRRSARQSAMLQDQISQPARDTSVEDPSPPYRRGSDATNGPSVRSASEQQPSSSSQVQSLGWTSQGMLSVPSHSPEPSRGSLSYALPSGAARRVVERYSLDDASENQPPTGSAETRQTGVDSNNQAPRSRSGTPQPTRPPSTSQDRSQSLLPSTPRHPSLPVAGIGSSSPSGTSSGQFPPIMPLAASPSYNPPVAPRNRAYPQQPTYITPANSANPVYSPQQPPQLQQPREEVCVECAMRDQEMADVDVTSPGAWERDSDAAFEELKQRELDDEANGIVNNDLSRPRIRGGRLTEQNLRLWLSINPKEPAARQQTVTKYVRAQRALLKEEALARTQAMQEAKRLDNKVRDAYTQLRGSAYDLGNHAAISDDTGGVRIKPPKSASPAVHTHHRTQSREITLLENGMIVEHVDVRKEEREAKERKRKEERRARKSSRSSAMEVTSIISANSNGRHTENGASLRPHSRYSQSSSARPISILTAPHERPDLPRAYSQASFSDVHSLGSGSPRRRFFGFRNLSAGWRSQDSLAPSAMTGGSMIDMHVALQRESSRSTRYFSGTPVDLNSPRRSQIWPPESELDTPTPTISKAKIDGGKKTRAITKLWRKMTGHKDDNVVNSDEPHNRERVDDDLPLAPPPPLSYLVDRGSPEMAVTGGRQNSSLSISSTPPKFGLSSSDAVEIRIAPGGRFDDADEPQDDGLPKGPESAKVLHPAISVPDMRPRSGIRSLSPVPPLPAVGPHHLQAISLASREKSLPPIPPGEDPAPPLRVADRPRTVYTYDPRPLPPGTGPAHDFLPPNAPFRSGDIRRQSFSGLSSRPNLLPQPIHINGKSATYDPRRSFSPGYDEFGSSRQSLGRIDNIQGPLPPLPRSPAPLSKESKRKSKFGLSSLLGKKNKSQDLSHEKSAFLFPTTPDGPEEWSANYATANSRNSGLSMGSPGQFNPRMSITSKKALEELVSQDSEFVAYRYPSNDQRLDLFR
ncbi:hypothetical protein P691DRAFT_236865 [Macrolepiota fuliginosa MF-IS2]|uniref:Uncharacterized protein n=1 Tax=Macrolepiota fuliginosa MF-IS2 TaxID=1400762 RepID=A0A9P5XL20_9AGAR|nr:hypothetical protein P691DRAFT_236865 [Macrolepiota fuliginosa MF-IS2]